MTLDPRLEEFVKFSAAALTPLIAVFGVYIARRQHFIQAEKLRLDLFDKRFAVFEALEQFLSSIVGPAEVSLERYHEFRSKTGPAIFLFGEDIESYLKEVSARALEFRRLNQQLAAWTPSTGTNRDELVAGEASTLNWISNQLESAPTRFARYLRFRCL